MINRNDMLTCLSQAHCDRLMPEWQGHTLTITPLSGGITNKLYRVQSSDGMDCVVRVYGRKTELFIDREMEMENIRRLASTGVTPRLIKYVPEMNVTIVEFIPGTPCTNADFLDDDLLDTLLRPIRLIHGSSCRLPRRFDPLQEVIGLANIVRDQCPEYPEFDIDGTIKLLGRLSDVANVSPSDDVPCHNDLLADNFIRVDNPETHGEPIFLIDWEYAGMSTPYYDLADMFQEILVSRESERNILRIYWDEKHMEEHVEKTDLFKPFPDIYWFLWSLIQLNVSHLEFDYYQYGKTKYGHAMENIRFCKEHYGLS